MKIIKVPLDQSNGSVSYPDDVSLFGKTIAEGGFLIGEYNGVLDLTLDDGVWPRPVPRQYQTKFKSQEFLEDLITDDEFDLMVASNNPTIKKIVRRFELRNKNIDVADSQYIGLIAVALTDGVIVDQARADELLLGIPV